MTIKKMGEAAHEHHDHVHHEHEDHQHHGSETKKTIAVEQNILSENALMAARNRGFFETKKIRCFNLMSSPGSGKTTLLEKTLTDLKKQGPFFVIEGDQQTSNDAERIHATGVPVVQINTGSGCHLNAHMIAHAVDDLNVAENAILFIENVGNLVCPALFDLGEAKRVVIISVTEGADKPVKYPTMFQTAQLCIINKIDLLPYVDFDVEQAKEYARRINPTIDFIEVSAKTGQGLADWYGWLIP